MNKKSKKPLVLITAIVALLLVIGYGTYAYMNNAWPFSGQGNGSENSDTTVEITKLEAKNDVLTVTTKLSNPDAKGHCVLMVHSKKTGLKIDDNETKKNSKQDGPFVDCLGWSVGVKDFPAGKYTVEVQFVGDNNKTVSTKDEITLK